MSYAFGKTIFCDGSNLSASRAYINNALISRGIVRDEESQLKFNSADAPTVINLIYDFLRKSEQDDATRENMSTKIREIQAENDRKVAAERQQASRTKALEKEVGVLKNHLAHAKDDLSKTNLEMKQLRDSLTRTTVALNHTKAQTSNDLRKRDAQISRMKEHLADGGTVRRSKASSSMTIRTNTASINHGPPILANYVTYDPSLQGSLVQECDDQLTKMVHEVSHENDQLAELIQATLASLDALVQIEEEEHPLFSSTSQSIIMLEAQLKVRLTALRNILEMPNYVAIEEVEIRDARIKELQQRLLQIEGEWSAAQNVLKGLTASVLHGVETNQEKQHGLQQQQQKEEKEGVRALAEWTDGRRNAINDFAPSSHHEEETEVVTSSSLKDHAKTPIAISRENGTRPTTSTVKIDSRLLLRSIHLGGDGVNSDELAAEPDSTPIRARRQKLQRKNRRATLGLLAREEDLHAELQEVLSDLSETHVSSS